MRTPPKPFPEGTLRECEQWSPDLEEYMTVRWDFAFKDPASGRWQQYSTCAMYNPKIVKTHEAFNEMVRAPAVACLARMIHRKCGMDQAVAHQALLDLPRHVKGRYV